MRKRQETVKAKFDENYATVEGAQDLETESEQDRLIREAMREMKIDNDKIYPSKELRKWMAA